MEHMIRSPSIDVDATAKINREQVRAGRLVRTDARGGETGDVLQGSIGV